MLVETNVLYPYPELVSSKYLLAESQVDLRCHLIIFHFSKFSVLYSLLSNYNILFNFCFLFLSCLNDRTYWEPIIPLWPAMESLQCVLSFLILYSLLETFTKTYIFLNLNIILLSFCMTLADLSLNVTFCFFKSFLGSACSYIVFICCLSILRFFHQCIYYTLPYLFSLTCLYT